MKTPRLKGGIFFNRPNISTELTFCFKELKNHCDLQPQKFSSRLSGTLPHSLLQKSLAPLERRDVGDALFPCTVFKITSFARNARGDKKLMIAMKVAILGSSRG